MGRLLRAISDNKTINMIAIDSKDMVEEARKVHQCTPVATAALGRVITAGTMMGVMMKEKNAKLTLQFKGDGPLGLLVCVSNSRGDAKEFIQTTDYIFHLIVHCCGSLTCEDCLSFFQCRIDSDNEPGR